MSGRKPLLPQEPRQGAWDTGLDVGSSAWNVRKASPPVREKIQDQKLSVLVINSILQSGASMSCLRSWGMLRVDGHSYRLQLQSHFFTQREEVLLTEVLQCSRASVWVLFLGTNWYGFLSQQKSPEFFLCIFRTEFWHSIWNLRMIP